MLAILAHQVTFAQATIHWAYVPDPPLLRPYTWGDPEFPVYVDQPILEGPSGEHIQPTTIYEFNFTGQSAHMPICFSFQQKSCCVQLGHRVQYTYDPAHASDPYLTKEWVLGFWGIPRGKPTNKEVPQWGLPYCNDMKASHFGDFPPWRYCAFDTPAEYFVGSDYREQGVTLYQWNAPGYSGTALQQIEAPGGWVAPTIRAEDTYYHHLWKLFASSGEVHVMHHAYNLSVSVRACVPSPFALVVGQLEINYKSGLWTINCSSCVLTNCLSGLPWKPYSSHAQVLIVHQPSFVMIPVTLDSPWYRDSGQETFRVLRRLLSRTRRMFGLIVLGIVSIITAIAGVASAAVAITQTVHTAEFVDQLAENVSHALSTQEVIDRKIEQRLNALEETVLFLGRQVRSLQMQAKLLCHAGYASICVTAAPYNASDYSWEQVQRHLLGVWSHTSLSLDIAKLHQDIQDIQDAGPVLQQPTEQAYAIFGQLQQWFSDTKWHSFLYSILLMCIPVIIILFCLPVLIRTSCSALQQLQVGLHHLRLKNKEGGTVGNQV